MRRRPLDVLWSVSLYAGMIGAAVTVFLLVVRRGALLEAPLAGVAAAGAATASSQNLLAHVLLALAAVIVTGRLVGWMLAAVGQPAVVGEVMGGIVLGPSLLGYLAPEASAFILPAAAAPAVGLVANLGVVLYLFLVGLDLDAGRVRSRTRATVAISHTGIIAPFVLGAFLALYLYPRYATADVPFTSFALFIGIALSITAFPVLARILADRGLTRTEIGAIALTCAAADDITAWCLLALVIGVARSTMQGAVTTVVLALCYVGIMLVVVRPLAARWFARVYDAEPTSGVLACVFVGLLLSTLATEAIGVHAFFGAFLFGTMIPHGSLLARGLSARMRDLVTIVFLPAFFAFTGMRTEIGLLSGAAEWFAAGLIVVVAVAGKLGGTVAAARLLGFSWKPALGLGMLLNTRGLMELVVLNIGLELGVISPTLFTMMVIMALVTTMMTTPGLAWLQAERAPAGSDRQPVHAG